MQHIQGISPHQLQVVSLEDTISQDNPVRFIDAFVHSIHLERTGFREQVLKTEGRPSFDTKVFLKTYTKITWQDSVFGLVSLSF
jgi:hypothetical protein